MRNVFMKSITVTAVFQKLMDVPTVLTVTITAGPANAQPLQFRVDGGAIANWPKGVSHTLVGVDLSRIEVKGTAGDTVLIVGGTW